MAAEGAAREERIRALEAEVRRLQLMLESAPDFITRTTTEGTFLYVNRVAPGFRKEEILGTSVEAYVPAEFHERVRRAFLDRAAEDPRRYLVLDAGASAGMLADRIKVRVAPLLKVCTPLSPAEKV